MNEDHFAEFLDAMVSGTAPDATPPPADIARRIQETATDRLDGERRSTIWKSLMSDHARPASTSGGPGPLAQPALAAPDAFNPWVRRRFPRPPERNRMGIVHQAMQTGITAMAIAAVVIAALAAFPILRGDEVTPTVTPTAWAAAPTTVASGFGSPGPDTPPSATYHHPQPNECRVEPLTVDEVMAAVEGGSSGRLTATPMAARQRPITEEEYRQLTDSHRSWMACHSNGTPFHAWAMETDEMIRTEVLRTSFPAYNPSFSRDRVEGLAADFSSEETSRAFTWSPPTDTFLPMVADWDPDEAPMVSEDGKVTVTITWMNRDGDVIIGDPDDPDLPVHWTYAWSESSGLWLLDSYEP